MEPLDDRQLCGDDPKAHERALEALTTAYRMFDEGRPTDALGVFGSAVAVLDATDPDTAAGARVDFAGLLRDQDMERDALRLLHEALMRFRSTGQDRYVADCLFNIGHVALDLFELEVTTESLTAARGYYELTGAEELVAGCDDGFAAIAVEEGRYEDALALYRSTRDTYTRLGDEANAAVSEMNIGDTLRQTGDLEAATRHTEAAIARLRSAGRDDYAARAESNLAWIRAAAGDDEAAQAHLAAAHAGGVAHLHLVDAVVHRHGGRLHEAIEAARKGLADLDDDESVPAADLLEELGRSIAASGDPTMADHLLRRARRVFRGHGLTAAAARCDDLTELLSDGWDPVLAEVAAAMGLGPDRTERDATGFRWWGPRLCQEIRLCEIPTGALRLVATVDVVGPVAADTGPLGDLGGRNAVGVGAYVRDPGTRMLRLTSAVSVQDASDPALSLFAACAKTQAARADADADAMAFVYEADVAETPPPAGLERTGIPTVPAGADAVASDELAAAAAAWGMDGAAGRWLAKDFSLPSDREGLRDEGVLQTVVRLWTVEAQHPLGYGTVVEITPPGEHTAVEAAGLTHRANLITSAEDCTATSVGAWCTEGTRVKWRAFVPAGAWAELTGPDRRRLATALIDSVEDVVSAAHLIIPSAAARVDGIPRSVTWGVIEDYGAVFIPTERAADLAALRAVVFSARCWGDLHKSLSAPLFEEALEVCWDEDEPPPDDDTEFCADSVGTISDGDWPGWPAQEMLSWMPKEILARFGIHGRSGVSGPCVSFSEDDADQITAALAAAGVELIRDDRLILNACFVDY